MRDGSGLGRGMLGEALVAKRTFYRRSPSTAPMLIGQIRSFRTGDPAMHARFRGCYFLPLRP